MANIINHLKNDTWKPKMEWPENCPVQWGRNGLVLGQERSYNTAFFEAFPNDGSAGFIRGEGKSLEGAELDAFEKWESQFSCNVTGHQWSRTRRFKDKTYSSYTNGGCFCIKCNAFKSAMKPIVKLGKWKNPLTHIEITLITMGIVPDKKNQKHLREITLKAKIAGIKIPEYKEIINREGIEYYEKKCREAVVIFFAKNINSINTESSKIGHLPDYQFKSLKKQAEKLNFLK